MYGKYKNLIYAQETTDYQIVQLFLQHALQYLCRLV